ncbi:MAG: DUF3168 domain-containing protein [Clostridiales bacterium]|jgi:hypothetical protein|nr:DUF3168 domain-containing protein [Clostridiales bacterium]
MKNELFHALLADEALLALVGRTGTAGTPCIFFDTPPVHDALPCVTFFEKDGSDAVFADDVCIARTVVMQTDVWSRESGTEICGRVDAVTRMLGYVRANACDLPEANLCHARAVYKKVVYTD